MASNSLDQLEDALDIAFSNDLFDDQHFGCRLDPDSSATLTPQFGKDLLESLDVGELLSNRPNDPCDGAHPYIRRIIEAWKSDKPILPTGLYILWGTGESGKSALLNKTHLALRRYGSVDQSIIDVGDVNSVEPPPIGSNGAMVEFLDSIDRRINDIISADDKIVFIDSLSWYDDIPLIAKSPAKKNGAPKAWEEYLKMLHRWFVKKDVIALATMNPNDDWQDGYKSQIQALYSSVAGAFIMGTGDFYLRYKKREGVEPRLHGKFNVAWNSCHGAAGTRSQSLLDAFVGDEDITAFTRQTELL